MAEVKGKDVTDSLPKNDSKIEKQDGKNDNKDSKNKKPWDYAVSATMSGILTKSACAPFDRIRLLYQVQGMFGNPTVDAVKYKSISHTAKTILREEGFVGFWRGNGTNMLRASVVYAMKFGTNDWMKERMLRKKKKRSARFEERMAKRSQNVLTISIVHLFVQLQIIINWHIMIIAHYSHRSKFVVLVKQVDICDIFVSSSY